MNALPFKVGDRLTFRPTKEAGVPLNPESAMTCVSEEFDTPVGLVVEVVQDGFTSPVRIRTNCVIRISDLRDLLVERLNDLERKGKPEADPTAWKKGDRVRFFLRGRKKSSWREGVITRINRKSASVASWSENPFTYRLDHVQFGELQRVEA